MSTIFDYIRLHIPILDVVSEYVTLKPAGSYWKGPCPFHKETDASFTVSPDKAIFYCFGCQASGDVIGFIAKKETLNQGEAAQHIIEQRGLDVPQDILSRSNLTNHTGKRLSAFSSCDAFALWANEQFKQSVVAQNYCKKRGIDLASALSFGIGYVPSGNRAINKCIKALHLNGGVVNDLISIGIFFEGHNGLHSPFEERIIFPIKDHSNRVCGFGGRIFKTEDTRAKYYNSKESDLFSKGKVLFGLDRAKTSIQQKQTVFLVEGYLDCLMMVSNGYHNTVATLGTACTIDHLKLLARFANKVYILFDGDAAGKKAVARLTQLCWEVNLELFVIQLPNNHDPASFLQENQDLTPFINQALTIFSFFIEIQSENFSKKPLAEKVAAAETIVSLITQIEDPLKKDLLLQEASSATSIPYNILKEKSIKRQKPRNFTKGNSPAKINLTTSQPAKSSLHSQCNETAADIHRIEKLIFALIVSGNTKNKILELEAELIPHFSEKIKSYLKAWQKFVQNNAHEKLTLSSFIEQIDKNDREWLLRASMTYEQDDLELVFRQLVGQFCKHNWKNIIRDLKEQMHQAHKDQDVDQLNRLFTTFSSLKRDIQSRGLI